MVLGIACSLTCKESSYFWGRGKAGSSISQLPPPREGVRKLDISQDFSPTLLNLGGGCWEGGTVEKRTDKRNQHMV